MLREKQMLFFEKYRETLMIVNVMYYNHESIENLNRVIYMRNEISQITCWIVLGKRNITIIMNESNNYYETMGVLLLQGWGESII